MREHKMNSELSKTIRLLEKDVAASLPVCSSVYNGYIKWLKSIGGSTDGIVPLSDIMRWKEEGDKKIW